ncbi:MAG: tRNA (adenosine(37)-N6)-threonylcarbamoyltransferase complex transferase subunit TsaD [Elusimicrobiota bacterium]|jgi:N6-L-threonylcarbamoyladenine synthase|nr:tRNA (adenosine(37)-N6)-threonylcarbamoyltransferase complex transferase subunit TsaD [Elusimicrobiota bacterium]
MDFYLLAIETTCDETSAALFKNGRELVSNVVYSQVDIHKKYRGVVPELASRAHAAKIAGVIKEALGKHKPDYIAFANGPGLPGGLLVGRVAAETLAMFYGAPIIGVNHLEGHLFACEFDGDKGLKALDFPLISLIVSGGHTELWLVKDCGRYKLLGKTRDDAAGEAFDKVAKLLGLGYPGGPEVSRRALEGKADKINFPRPYMNGTFEFSFSGLKTAVSYYLQGNKNADKADVCAAFQAAVVDTLVKKTMDAAKKFKVKNIAVGGGVAANAALRARMREAALKDGVNVRFAPRALAGDNAAMIALCAYKKIKGAKRKDDNIKIKPDMMLKNWGA